MKPYTLESYDAADADIEAAFHWYQTEQPGLGLEFLDELRGRLSSNCEQSAQIPGGFALEFDAALPDGFRTRFTSR